MTLVSGFGVHIKVASIEASRDFYEKYLELTPVFAYGDPKFLKTVPDSADRAPERYRGVMYELPGGARLEIADGHVAVKDPATFATTVSDAKVSAMVNVTSLVPLLAKSDRRPKSPAKHYYWGTVEMVLRDPDGWVVVLIAPFSPEEFAGVSQYVQVEEIRAPE